MSSKKGKGSTSNGRDSKPKMLGIKVFGGGAVQGGTIISRQRGTRIFPGVGVGMGRDHTIFAKTEGHVTFHKGLKGRTFISVLPAAEAAE